MIPVSELGRGDYHAPRCREPGCDNVAMGVGIYCYQHIGSHVRDSMHPHRGPSEGSWYGPDKLAHALFILAVTGWSACYGHGQLGWAVSILVAVLWEISNRWWVDSGRRGMSILDLLGFLVGGMGAGLLLWWAP